VTPPISASARCASVTANTCKDGLLGNMYRAKYTTGNTNDRIDLMTDGIDGLAMTRREDETWKFIGAFEWRRDLGHKRSMVCLKIRQRRGNVAF
jgi:hypothetical protein